MRSLKHRDAGGAVGTCSAVHFGHGTDLAGGQLQHVRVRIHHSGHRTAMHIEPEYHREIVVLHRAAVELDPQVDRGHDDPAQVHNTFDKGGSMGETCGLFVRANFLHAKACRCRIPRRPGKMSGSRC